MHTYQSNQDREGIVGPGAEWHNDGSFLTDVFSHAGYHIGTVQNFVRHKFLSSAVPATTSERTHTVWRVEDLVLRI